MHAPPSIAMKHNAEGSLMARCAKGQFKAIRLPISKANALLLLLHLICITYALSKNTNQRLFSEEKNFSRREHRSDQSIRCYCILLYCSSLHFAQFVRLLDCSIVRLWCNEDGHASSMISMDASSEANSSRLLH